ncbi:MAG: metallophosphoesterase [Gammaproteobacteria bacterium]|nr:metallophosphoesterase [Gammaproteobacteria bacterium]
MPPLTLDPDTWDYLARRLGKTHLRRRLGIEVAHEADRLGQGRNVLHIENWKLFRQAVSGLLALTGLAARGRRNVLDIRVVENKVVLPHLPAEFDGFTILQIADPHLDVLPGFAHHLAELVRGLEYDIAVFTGDYRFQTHGSQSSAMDALAVVRGQLGEAVYAILGNHDSLRMIRPIEEMGIRLLMNESVVLERGDARIHLAGVDDPHYFATDNLEAASGAIPDEAVSILLAHSPELYRHAAFAGFDLMLCGHTHGGQICLPGGVAITYNMAAPRSVGRGVWSCDGMQGYTSAGTGSSVVVARFNCPPEVTLHHLRQG